MSAQRAPLSGSCTKSLRVVRFSAFVCRFRPSNLQSMVNCALRMKRFIRLVLFYSLLGTLIPVLLAENRPPLNSDRSATIPRMQQPPTLEDFATMEPSPRMAGKMARIEGFRQWIPHDGDPVSQRTVAYLGYDDKNFYAVFVCFDNEPGKIRAHLGHRDDIWDDDFVDVWIDSFHDHRRAYEFVVNPLGVQGEGLATDNNEDFSFDTVWDSTGQINQQGWVAWFAIPFKSLRFTKEPVQTWGITLQREIHRANEKSFWPYTTQRRRRHHLAKRRDPGNGKHFAWPQHAIHTLWIVSFFPWP